MPYSFLFWYIVHYHETVTGKLISLIFSGSPIRLLHGEEIFLKVDYKFYFPRTWYCLLRAVWNPGYISFLMLLQQIITTSMLKTMHLYSLTLLEFICPQTGSLIWGHGIIHAGSSQRHWRRICCLLHLLEFTYIPWLRTLSFIFSASSIAALVFSFFPSSSLVISPSLLLTLLHPFHKYPHEHIIRPPWKIITLYLKILNHRYKVPFAMWANVFTGSGD